MRSESETQLTLVKQVKSARVTIRQTIEIHEAALKIAEKHGYNIYDALVVSAALEAGCVTLYSEDLHDGQTIDGQLTIRNPFVGSSG